MEERATSIHKSFFHYVVDKGLNFGLVFSLFLCSSDSPNKSSRQELNNFIYLSHLLTYSTLLLTNHDFISIAGMLRK